MPELPKLRGPWTSRIKTIKSKVFEKAGELGRWGKREQEAATAREIESDRNTLWSILGTGACLFTGLGPACIPIGSAVGKVAKGFSGGSLSAVEDMKMDTSDVGRWHGTEDRAALEATNRELEKYDTAEFWSRVKDFGMSLMSAYRSGGGISATGGLTPGAWSPTKWGGEEILGEIDPLTELPEVIRPAGQTTSEFWSNFFNKEK